MREASGILALPERLQQSPPDANSEPSVAEARGYTKFTSIAQ
jgi:hypothetical protein